MAAAAGNSGSLTASVETSNASMGGGGGAPASNLNGQKQGVTNEWSGSNTSSTVVQPLASPKPGNPRAAAFSESHFSPIEGGGGLNLDNGSIGNTEEKKGAQYRTHKSTESSTYPEGRQQDDENPDNIRVRRASSAPQFADTAYRKHRSGERAEYLWKRGKYLKVRC